MNPELVVKEILSPQEYEERKNPKKKSPSITQMLKKMATRSKSGVIIDNISNLSVKFAGCCKPIFGDPIKGFVSRNRGLIIHHKDCRNLAVLEQSEPDRVLEVKWDETQHIKTKVALIVKSINVPEIFTGISKVITSENIPVVKYKQNKSSTGNIIENYFEIIVESKKQLEYLLIKIKKLRGVYDVARKSV
jgi:GTP pyrophosphokinase